MENRSPIINQRLILDRYIYICWRKKCHYYDGPVDPLNPLLPNSTDCSISPFLNMETLDEKSEILKTELDEHIKDLIRLSAYETQLKKYSSELEDANNILYAIGKGYACLFVDIVYFPEYFFNSSRSPMIFLSLYKPLKV